MVYGLWIGGLAALVLIVATLVSVFRNDDVRRREGPVGRADDLLPFLGSLIYFTVRRGW